MIISDVIDIVWSIKSFHGISSLMIRIRLMENYVPSIFVSVKPKYFVKVFLTDCYEKWYLISILNSDVKKM